MDPGTLTLALLNSGMMSVATASALPSAASVIGGVSLASSALGSIAQGRAASQSAKYNAQIQQNNAQIAEQNSRLASEEGAANAAAASQKTRAEVGGIKAAQAANNLDVNKGSAVDVRSSAAELGELNAITIRSNAACQAYGYQTQSASDTAQADLDRQQGKSAETAGYINAGTTLLSGGAQGSNTGLWGDYTNKNSLNSYS